MLRTSERPPTWTDRQRLLGRGVSAALLLVISVAPTESVRMIGGMCYGIVAERTRAEPEEGSQWTHSIDVGMVEIAGEESPIEIARRYWIGCGTRKRVIANVAVRVQPTCVKHCGASPPAHEAAQ